ncbi:hypothetical protein [Cellulomonas edaphi]|uniref:Uncharacterized protein n=1 Tax=Cellulomonas edaphi TaxID=3053468 RepID=A0ABT7S9P3_9CELL|nr:hypothetical protein [Cellulomons edaphi]MDM7832338.1 hypothetical protein [Cellulomons edaphi]
MLAPHDGRLARLTATAVGRAAALCPLVAADELAAVLYRAGGTAVDPSLDPRLPRLLCDRAVRPLDLRGYARSGAEHWEGWTAQGVETDELVHKIYVSPTVAALPVALPVVFDLAVRHGVPSWKVGADAPGIHRADKVVLYLPTARKADDVAALLADALADLPAQGVPFSGQVGQTGIVSRGQDQGRQSWRAAVCAAVAQALHDSRSRLADVPPARLADEALRALANDIDVVTWHPGLPVAA